MGEGASLVSDDDLAACLRVLRALAPDGVTATAELQTPRLKPLRIALQPLLEDVGSRLLKVDEADRRRAEGELRRERHRRDQRQRAFERGWADKTRMRNERLKMLEALEASDDMPRAPDGAVGLLDAAALPLLTDDAAGSTGGAATVPDDGVAGAIDRGSGCGCAAGHIIAAMAAVRLVHHRACYACKVRFDQLHHFYAQLCPPCAELNWVKRTQTADLSGRIVLLTGARVKIGFCAALRLLRCGATVLATTRFPVDASDRFAALPDFSAWSERLHVYGVDLRDVSAIERLCEHVRTKFGYVTDVINNACQTVRRPARYYAHLIDAEMAPLDAVPAERRRLLRAHAECFGGAGPTVRSLGLREVGSGVGGCTDPADTTLAPVAAAARRDNPACVPSALWCQLPMWSGGSSADDADAFPVGLHDVNGQQLDLRTTNSWVLRLHEVSTHEAAEALAINALAPFVLNARLRPLLIDAPVLHRFVVNVSAMEGKFNRYKTPNHPHTNMAKAALNMMTKTCAEELASHRVYMNSVDTGWINDENPTARAAETAARSGFQTPLDELDAAARIVDPILSTCNGSEPAVYGKFLKDYRVTEW
jgi:NAD(P)-dependent dehydrogenase (short-subunit alcohol dehydrogenase family)